MSDPIPWKQYKWAKHVTSDIAEKFAPIVWLDKKEKYYPCGVSWYLPHVEMLKNGDTEIPRGRVARNGSNLRLAPHEPGYYDGDYSLNLDKDFEKGDKSDSLHDIPFYWHSIWVDENDHSKGIDIQYWLFYATSGPINRVNWGKHEADWECVVVRVDEEFNKILGGIFYAHGDPEFVGADDLDYESNRMVAYSALATHASYASNGKHYHGNIDNTGRGEKWLSHNLVMLKHDPTQDPENPWNRFVGDWSHATQEVKSPAFQDGWNGMGDYEQEENVRAYTKIVGKEHTRYAIQITNSLQTAIYPTAVCDKDIFVNGVKFIAEGTRFGSNLNGETSYIRPGKTMTFYIFGTFTLKVLTSGTNDGHNMHELGGSLHPTGNTLVGIGNSGWSVSPWT